MNKLMVAAVMALCLAGTAFAAVVEEAVSYRAGDTEMKGYIVYDDAVQGARPGVIVIHEWWGITPHVREEARKFAAQGYTAFVADMYGGGRTADNPKDAGALAGSVRGNPQAMQARFQAAKDALRRHATVDGARIGAAGYCFGGSVALDMARAGLDLRGVVAFHAGLGAAGAAAAPGKVRARVLVLNGEADPLVKPDQIEAFKKEMADAKVDYRFINYPGALHAFTNPEATARGQQFQLPLAYDEKADKQSKAEASAFFKAVFGN